MLHPRLSLTGGTPTFLATVGPYGAWSDLAYSFRYGEGACGTAEASWSMPLPADFEHPLLRRGTLVELMDGPWRVGSPLILSEPARGGDGAWSFTAFGVGREVEGPDSWYALDGSLNTSVDLQVAIDRAISDGLPWDGRDASIFSGSFSTLVDAPPMTLGALLTNGADYLSKRWGVGQDNIVRFLTDPTTPTYHVVPGAAALGVADDDYASVVIVRYKDSGAGGALTSASATESTVNTRYGRREFLADLSGDDYAAMDVTTANAFATGILAKSKGRLGWTNGLTLTSQEILTSGGVPANLSKVAEDVGNGCMIRLHGIFNDLLEYNGQTYLDLIIGEAKLVDGAQTIDLSPLGLAARDLASVVEAVTGMASVA